MFYIATSKSACGYPFLRNKGPLYRFLWLMENDSGTCQEIVEKMKKKGKLFEIEKAIRAVGHKIRVFDKSLIPLEKHIKKIVKVSPKY